MAISQTELNELFEEFLTEIQTKGEFDIPKIRKAFEFAKKAHLDQKRANGDPYLTHPFEVAKIVFAYGLDSSSIISALLHDVVEDTSYTLSDIKKEFGEEVEIIVDGLTKIATFAENREEKNIEALRKILLASAKDIRVLVIKLCDRLHNLRTLDELPVYKQERIARNSMYIYAPIAQKIGIYSLKWELEDLAFKYINPEMFQLIKKKVGLKRYQREIIVQKTVDEIKSILETNNVKNVVVLGRPKNFYSIYKKIKDKAKSFEDILDLYAVRVIVKDIGACYSVLGTLHENFQAFPDRLKDYIANPKANGYQSIHTTIYSRAIKHPVEVQIRTDNMHKLAEFGIAAHWKYKNLREDKKFEKKIAWLREVLQWEKENKNSNDFLQLLKYDFFQNEIFVFTPKNDIIFLPENSSALDFAYAIHTEIGNKIYKAKINGEVTNIDKTLKNGDIVEIITRNNVKPTEKWLKLVKTSKAKLKIRDAINLKYRHTPDSKVIDVVSFETLKNELTRVDEFKKVRKGGCCKLEYGDQVIGVLTKEKELVVHNASCENAKFTLSQKINLNWKKEKKKEVILTLHLKDRHGILMDILNLFSQFNLNISELNTKVQKDGTVNLVLRILDGPHIENLVKMLQSLETVQSVKVNRGIFSTVFKD